MKIILSRIFETKQKDYDNIIRSQYPQPTSTIFNEISEAFGVKIILYPEIGEKIEFCSQPLQECPILPFIIRNNRYFLLYTSEMYELETN